MRGVGADRACGEVFGDGRAVAFGERLGAAEAFGVAALVAAARTGALGAGLAVRVDIGVGPDDCNVEADLDLRPSSMKAALTRLRLLRIRCMRWTRNVRPRTGSPPFRVCARTNTPDLIPQVDRFLGACCSSRKSRESMMNMTKLYGLPLLLLAAGSVACTSNPTVNEESSFAATGQALDVDGSPLVGAEVRLLRYFHPLSIFEPGVDSLFECNSSDWRVCGDSGLDFELALVDTVTTDDAGEFRFDFLGADIIAEQSIPDLMGNRQSSNLVIVVLDPNDTTGKVGVYSYDFTVAQGIREVGVGDLQLWGSGATVDTTNALITGEVVFSWNRLQRTTQGDNIYRLEIGPSNGPRLLITCAEGEDVLQGGCEESGNQLVVRVSAFTIFTFYSNAGVFDAFVRGDGMDHRQRARFESPPTLMQIPRTRVNANGVWAVGGGQVQELTSGAATDDDPATQQTITIDADAIYVQVNGAAVSDAGLLNSMVSNVQDACVVVEVTTTIFADIDAAQASVDGDWTDRGRFCGSGIDDTISAIINFPQTQGPQWLRFVIDSGSTATFQSVGEVAVYQP